MDVKCEIRFKIGCVKGGVMLLNVKQITSLFKTMKRTDAAFFSRDDVRKGEEKDRLSVFKSVRSPNKHFFLP